MTSPTRYKLPFQAEHIDSLARPSSLVLARQDFDAGRIDAVALRCAKDEAIRI